MNTLAISTINPSEIGLICTKLDHSPGVFILVPTAPERLQATSAIPLPPQKGRTSQSQSRRTR